MQRSNGYRSGFDSPEENVRTLKSKINSTETVIYRLLRGYSPDLDAFIYSMLISLYKNNVIEDETYAFDVARDSDHASSLLLLAVEYETVPSTFYDCFEFIEDKLL